jgi:hypothetical protein
MGRATERAVELLTSVRYVCIRSHGIEFREL